MSRKPMMQGRLEAKVLEIWRRSTRWMSLHGSIIRLVLLSAGVVVYFFILPVSVRIFFWSGLRSHPILAVMLLIFSLLAISLLLSAGQRLDAWAFLLLNVRGSRPSWLDRTMLGFTQIGSGFASLGIALLLYLSGYRLLAYDLILGAVTLWLVIELLKFFVRRSRPFIRLTQTRIVGNRASGRSFPSGHTGQVFFMATMLAQYFHASIWIVLLLYTTAFLVGITRMYVGAHYPRDVLAGAILGNAWGLLGGLLTGTF